MDELAAALERFNRTEPDLLFRDAFGDGKKELRLAEDFRNRVAKASGVENIPECAWWAAEYPFNALAGAIALYVAGESAMETRHSNDPTLITSGREDVDFVISFRQYLILIEAKAYTPNDNGQVTHKLSRLTALRDFCHSLRGYSERPICFRFVLTSPTKPEKLCPPEWPSWACKGEVPPWMPLSLPHRHDILQVKRCSDDGLVSQHGRKWKIVPGKVFQNSID